MALWMSSWRRCFVPEAASRPVAEAIRGLVERVRRILDEREGRPAPGGPQYGESLKDAHVELVRDVFWDLFRSGVITLGMNDGNDFYPFFRLSRSGRGMLEDGQPRFHDAIYTFDLSKRPRRTSIPWSWPTCGGGDRVLCRLPPRVRSHAMGCGGGGIRVHRGHSRGPSGAWSGVRIRAEATDDPAADARVPAADGTDRSHAATGIREQLDTTYSGIQNLLRVSRNEAGHPTGAPVDRDFAFAS